MDIKPFDKKVWLASPTMHGEELKYIEEAYNLNWMSTVGKNIDETERLLAEKVGVKYAVTLSSGTAALHLAIKLAGVKAGDRVFCSDMTFAATVNPVVYEGGIPVFIDSEYETWNMDPKALEKAFELYPDTKVVVLVHLYGTPAKFDEIKAICDKYGAKIVEDAAESLGATYRARQTGSLGDYNIISFNGNKIITGSSGGMFLTNSEADAEQVRKWSTQSREDAEWYQHEQTGYNYRMSNVIAGVVLGQIPYLEEHIKGKKAVYERYSEGLKGLPVSMNPFEEKTSVPNYWLSCMLIERAAMCKQIRTDLTAEFETEKGKTCPTEILAEIERINAQGRPIWKPMHLQPIYKNNEFFTKDGLFDGNQTDVGADIFDRGLCLPSDNKMTAQQQEKIIEVIKRCFE